MSRKNWTAVVPSGFPGIILRAQLKGTKQELMARLRADDPVWHRLSVRLVRMKRFANYRFRRGLAITAVKANGEPRSISP